MTDASDNLTAALDEWFAAEFAVRISRHNHAVHNWSGGVPEELQMRADECRIDLVAQLMALAQAYVR